MKHFPNETQCPCEFAPNFTKENFFKLKFNTDTNAVIELLGQPFQKTPDSENPLRQNWVYSRQLANVSDTACWYKYQVFFNEKQVLENFTMGLVKAPKKL